MKTEIKKEDLNEMSSGGGGSVGDGGATGNNSGAYETPTAWSGSNSSRRFFKNTLVRGSKIVNGGLPDNNMSMKESTSLDTLLEEFNTLMSELDAEPSLNTTPNEENQQQNVFTYHIVTNNENDFYADVRDPNGNTKFELNDMGEINILIADGIMKSKEDVEGLAKYLKSKHILGNQDILQIGELNEGNMFDKELAIGDEVIVNSGGLVGDKNLIGQIGIVKDINNHLVGVMLDKGGYSKFNKGDVRKKDSTIPIKNSMNEIEKTENVDMPVIKRHFDVLAEEAKPNGLIQAERIKGINDQNSLNYYKTLNDGIQDMIAADKPVMGDIEATIKYEYDNKGEKINNGVYPDEKKNNDEYLATADRGIADYILDVPNDKYEERLEKMTTNKELYNMIKDKQKAIKALDLRNMPKGKMEVVPHGVNESYMSGYYFDLYGNKKIKTFNLSKITETELLNEDVKHFETKGVGNVFNEIIKEEIEKFNFYYDTAGNQLVKIKKENDTNKHGNFLNESTITKLKYLNNYDPSKNVKNLVDRSRL